MSVSVCSVIETELNIALGMLDALKPQANLATKAIQQALVGVVSIGYADGIVLITQLQQAIVNTCAVQCLSKELDADKAVICKLLKACIPAKDLLYNKLGILLSYNPLITHLAKEKGMTSSQYVTTMLFKADKYFEEFICNMGIEDYINMVAQWLKDELTKMVQYLDEWITKNITLNKLDQHIYNIMNRFQPIIDDVRNAILAVEAFIQECPLLCDLSDNLLKKLDNYKQYRNSMETIMSASYCYGYAFNSANAEYGFNYMRQQFQDCKAQQAGQVVTTCNRPYKWLCSLDNYTQNKLNQFNNALTAWSNNDLSSCVTHLGGEEAVKAEKENLFDVIFNADDKAEMGKQQANRISGLVGRLSGGGYSIPNNVQGGTFQLNCGKKAENEVTLVKNQETKAVAPKDVVPVAPTEGASQLGLKDAKSSVNDNTERKVDGSPVKTTQKATKRLGRKSHHRKKKAVQK